MPVDVGQSELRARMGTFLAGDHPHPGRPGGQVEEVGQLGDPGAVADLAVAGVRRVSTPCSGIVEPIGPSGRAKPGSPSQALEPLSALLTRRHADLTVTARPLTDYAHAAGDTTPAKENR